MANPWTSFYELIKGSKRSIAYVVSTDSNTKRVLVTEFGASNNIYVESNGSTYANGSYVFIESGVIVGQAPDLRTITTELLT